MPPGDRPQRPLGTIPTLPAGFRFGVSTSAYQVEGGTTAAGRGSSIWDTFAAQPGRVHDGSTGDPACDHLNRSSEDVALLKRLGVQGYKFSISWSRVQPAGTGPANEAGLDFYDRLLDDLLGNDIVPMATLHHHDLPQALEDDGGWLNRGTVEAFTDYAALVGERFGDRVAAWVPIHEPHVTAWAGYGNGEHAPGRRLGFDCLWAHHHLLLAHGRAAIALRSSGPGGGAREVRIGCANDHAPIWPASDDEADIGAAKLVDALWNGSVLEPMLLGRYPADITPLMADIVEDGDLATIRQPLDFYGVDYLAPMRAAAAPPDSEIPFALHDLVGYPTTDHGLPIVPDALREWLIMLRARFRAALPPIVVTGSGASYAAPLDPTGLVDDQARIDYLAAHLEAVATACRRGVDVRGFYVWTLLDCFEWAQGHREQFGLVHVDRTTQARTPKRSYQWYADVIAAHASP